MLNQLIDLFQEKVIWESPERALRIYEKIPRAFLEHYRLMNLKRTLKLAAERSIFYAKQFEDFPFNLKTIQSPRDLYSIFTSERDLTQNPLNHFLCGRAETAFESTGTTSKNPKRIFFSYRELEDAGRVGAAGLWRLGVRREDRVVSAFDYSFWVSGPALKASLENLGTFHVEAGRMDPADFYERVKPYQCNVIVADPGWLVRLSEVAEEKGAWPVKLMIVGGENLSEMSRKYIEAVWLTKVVLSYGQTEAFGMVGIECSEQAGYHVNDMDLWVEIPVADKDGWGELVYTTLRRTVMPLIRYRSGDVTKINTEPCKCGMPSIRLEKLKGRIDEMAVTAVGNLVPWMFQEVLDGLPFRVNEWQVLLKQRGRRDLIELRAEIGSGAATQEEVRTAAIDGMRKKMPVAHQGILNGLADFGVELYAVGTLRQGRKVKRILDERDFRQPISHGRYVGDNPVVSR